ncbi:CPBP family intramembrane metalloprotease [Bacteroidales bacterium OttesenSCG-928-K03]|nr:CPBP family intramembrane metalloprotease [Bacteroidales bacterium OttesenSCG-928-L14]MDL2240938.1 CPBP family intramembrane metalloprotease [Bacteroidales bacterium OttesenSCG-928-K22]MDL2243065.1 CPBP family intramembrane metalloprotease [Bacteroidales bacterium OttesenSCG-928-K03]
MNKRKTILAITVFYIIAISLRFITNKTGILEGINSFLLKAVLEGMGPTIGALISILIFKIPIKMSLKGNFKNMIIPFSIYWLLPILLIGTTAYFTNGTFPIITIFTVLIYGLLEEIGWRGFLQQLLKPLPKFWLILIITILWFVWHLDFSLTTGNLIFFGILLLGSWGIGLVSDATNSLLAVAAFHSLNNFFSDFNTLKIIILIVLITIWILSVIFSKRLNFTKNEK